MRRASRQAWCEAPAHSFTLAEGVGGWGAAPQARSTPTLPTRAQQDVGKDTPKKLSKNFILHTRCLFLNFIPYSTMKSYSCTYPGYNYPRNLV
ncbi:MAG: hypothetical protein NZ455_07605 [Bacteroidia bacterium]|nr:hypothetical protein [Bacteroidia bacterium]MDW8345617.1 hypothetical protein [Bacteroidia bacterium]